MLLAARLIVEEALEGEVRDKIGRERYERADGEAEGYRNGYRRGRMKTAEGMMEFSAPQVRDTPAPFVSAIRESLAGRTQALEWAVDPRHRGHLHRRGWPPAALARGGERDHRAAMGGVRGVHQARSVRVPDRLSLRRWDCRAAARWPPARGGDCGIGEDGRKVLLHLMAGSKEDTETVRASSKHQPSISSACIANTRDSRPLRVLSRLTLSMIAITNLPLTSRTLMICPFRGTRWFRWVAA